MATPKKKTTAKKTVVKKPRAHKTNRHAPLKSFHPSHEREPFLEFRATRQTVYWLILATITLVLGLWITHLEVEIQSIYDTIEMNNISINDLEQLKTQKQSN